MLTTMNAGHSVMADWGMGHLPPIDPKAVVDLGCGAGRNAGELLKRYPKAKVTAIDYSPLSVEKARSYNSDAIVSGRCAVEEGNVADLKLPAATFDLATAFETVYFAVTRRDLDGTLYNSYNVDQKLTLAEALKGYTYGSNYADGFEEKAGTLEKGKYADIVVWDKNPFAIDPDEIRNCKAACTIFNGRVVYEA